MKVFYYIFSAFSQFATILIFLVFLWFKFTEDDIGSYTNQFIVGAAVLSTMVVSLIHKVTFYSRKK